MIRVTVGAPPTPVTIDKVEVGQLYVPREGDRFTRCPSDTVVTVRNYDD